MKSTVSIIAIAILGLVRCAVPDTKNVVSDSTVRSTIIDGFHKYDSANFERRHVCFFNVFVMDEMDSVQLDDGWRIGELQIQSRFFHYVDFGFAIITRDNKPFYYGLSDIYAIEHAVNLDSVITFTNPALAELLEDCFNEHTIQSDKSVLSNFLYHLYFQNRSEFSSPMFESSDLSIEDLVFELNRTDNSYKEYFVEILSTKDNANHIIFELRHSGYLVFEIVKTDGRILVQEFFIPHADRPFQLSSDAVSEVYSAKCSEAN
jgi:hypothetical protein